MGSIQEVATAKVLPTGECWCGCGSETSIGAFFVSGHDRRAEAAVVKAEYENVPTFLVRHGYGPGGKNPTRELDEFRRRGGKYL
jgi:hypothetical protein